MDEMLDREVFTRKPRWQAKIFVKHLLTDEDDLTPEQINEKGMAIASVLRRCDLFDDNEIITNFEQVDDYDEFNSILDDMYSECDRVRIWCE